MACPRNVADARANNSIMMSSTMTSAATANSSLRTGSEPVTGAVVVVGRQRPGKMWWALCSTRT